VQYLGMSFDYSIADEVAVRMGDGYLQELMDEWGIFQSSPTPAVANLFDIDTSSKLLGDCGRQKYHSSVQKLLYQCSSRRYPHSCGISHHQSEGSRTTRSEEVDQSANASICSKWRRSMRCRSICRCKFGGGHYCNDDKRHSGILTSIGSGPVFPSLLNKSL
jgi:hypothetical protein